MKERFRQFMVGRYGTDEFNNFLTVAVFIVIVIIFGQMKFILNQKIWFMNIMGNVY
jgi:hypothetical protein